MALGVLVTWRVTHLLHAEDGPWQLLARLRRLVQAAGGKLFDCFYCLSLWVAVPLAYLLGESWEERGLLIPALSGAAILVERVTTPPMPNYVEDSEVPDGLLWKEPNRDVDHSDEHGERT
jgi:hypothetical protein